VFGPTPAFVDEADHGRDHFEEARRPPPKDTTSSWQGLDSESNRGGSAPLIESPLYSWYIIRNESGRTKWCWTRNRPSTKLNPWLGL
jgi:hypothetical protein